ncbi:cytochrome c maturation protein CcmE [Oceanithermus desulfurans]|uniref:Cytochrome c-type biogenesis protein CcmE n=2 Tax=Oceanithermus desulfurans TaxID=227924 RepID=A0A511RK43_9DEIN|nr:cytochrome c maturation protein CcmE [Oceanithermus desulfurans]MBB6030684.1 cytochrome c-type biogenesis protein CcmE [Oceanithermus desulfurans]GEM89437.1 cytochrome c-type biogenesis protein CcmE [Oceanithermus desulfurans NBRC 100063]
MKTKYLIGFLIVVAAIAYLAFGGLGNSLVYYVLPSEYAENPARYEGKRIRLGGLVKEGTIRYDPQTLELDFVVTDGVVDIPVQHEGTPPELFKDNQGVVVEGRFDGRVFKGDNLLIKHSETYQAPPEGGYTPEEVRKLIEEAK